MTHNEHYMKLCLELAERGRGAVAPNPMVGCVIVYNGRIIGEGWHEKFGEAHAEVNAINSVIEEDKNLLSESTLYVNLEPCSHQGKTSPCADLIIKTGIPRVVFASDDPNPLVSGKGKQKLLDAGIKVASGVLKEEADFLNRKFLTSFTRNRPYVILKWAESADGYVAPSAPKQVWISGEPARELVHKWRAEEQAVLVGRHTVEIDDPQLNVRFAKGKDPARVVIDPALKLTPDRKVFRPGAEVYIYNSHENSDEGHVHHVKIDLKKNVPAQILEDLHSRGIQSLMVEGGPDTFRGFVDAGLWDEARILTAKIKLYEGKRAPQLHGIVISDDMIGQDRLVVMLNTTA